MKTVLVTGGAGFIGSHTCKTLYKAGFYPIIIDNLSSGYRDAVRWGTLIEADITPTVVQVVCETHRPRAACHFAGSIEVGESIEHPAKYYRNNTFVTAELLDTLGRCGVQNFVFSSTAAVYGDPLQPVIDESHSKSPINPYGKSKWMIEEMLSDFERTYGIRSVSLRYFNAAGADPEGELGENHNPETHLIPLVIGAALGIRPPITIYGDDYPTPDGSCIRDYIHVTDLADAHHFAIQYLMAGGKSCALNLGNGEGISVRTIIETVGHVLNCEVPTIQGHRRPGDPAVLVAKSDLAKAVLGIEFAYPSVVDMITHAANWYQKSNSSIF